MKKIINFFRENLKGLFSVLPIVVFLPLAVPAWSANVPVSYSIEKWPVASEAWPSEAWPVAETNNYPEQAWPNGTISEEESLVATDAWPYEAWPETGSISIQELAWPNEAVPANAWPSQESYDAITLRTVVLHRADRQNSNVISAELVSVDEKYMISYEGNLYEIKPLAGNSRYDSLVEIYATYQFRMKLYPYE